MRVHVTGATGFDGKTLCARLDTDGGEVRRGLRGSAFSTSPGPLLLRSQRTSRISHATRFEGTALLCRAARNPDESYIAPCQSLPRSLTSCGATWHQRDMAPGGDLPGALSI